MNLYQIYNIISKQTNLNRTQRERNEDEKLPTTDPKRGFHDQLVANMEHRNSTQLGRTVSSIQKTHLNLLIFL